MKKLKFNFAASRGHGANQFYSDTVMVKDIVKSVIAKLENY